MVNQHHREVSGETSAPAHGTRRMHSQPSHQMQQPYRVIFPTNAHRQQPPPPPHQYSTSNKNSNITHSSVVAKPTAGTLIPPRTSIARALLMGNTISEDNEQDNKYRREEERGLASSSSIATDSNNPGNAIPERRRNSFGAIPLAVPNGQQPTANNSNFNNQVGMSSDYNHDYQQPKSGLSALLDHEQQKQQRQQQQQQQQQQGGTAQCTCDHSAQQPQPSVQDEADSASGPPPPKPPAVLGHSAPTIITTMKSSNRRGIPLPTGTPPLALMKCACTPPSSASRAKRLSLPSPASRHLRQNSLGRQGSSFNLLGTASEHNRVRRCISSKELGTLAPPSGSPYANMLSQREALENEMRDRLRLKRDSITIEDASSPQEKSETAPIHRIESLSSASTTFREKGVPATSRKKTKNEYRNQRRAAHHRAVVDDLCDVVADLFVAESKLINPTKYGVSWSLGREQVLKSVQKFAAALPTRYALGVGSPSEVLLHMRLMAVARSDNTKSVVHIVNLDNDSYWTDNCAREKSSSRQLRLVTICCADANGLLEFITRILGTGGSRVLDADVMLSSDRIVLDRFVVEMNGRLRLDKVSQLIESFLKKDKEKEEHDNLHKDDCSCQDGSQGTQSFSGPLYYNPEMNVSSASIAERNFEEEINKAVPLTEVLASPTKNEALLDPGFDQLRRHFSMPVDLACRGSHAYVPNQQQTKNDPKQSNDSIYTPVLSKSYHDLPSKQLEMHLLDQCPGQPEQPCPTHGVQVQPQPPLYTRQHQHSSHETHPLESCPGQPEQSRPSHGVQMSQTPPSRPAHGIPISPPCSTRGLRPANPTSNSVSSTYEEEHENDAAGQSMRHKRPLVNRSAAHDLDRVSIEGESVDYVTVPPQSVAGQKVENRVVPLIPFDELMLIEAVGTGRVSTIYRAAWQNPLGVQMVALKVAMVSPETGDHAHVDELRREADIAARLKHPNVCDLVGVAADSDCFCLAYDYCEGGSVLSLLSDTSRYYEYLPIALDVANAMAYLHSRDVIHRDLKPSNVLLTRDHRAKIADFGMSVANAGQELTAETGTYRYMAPEVIRHESYSSNADVYSFGVFLWQLITRQVPFASMTPVQAAYAVAEGRRPEIPESTPARLKEIVVSCWDQDSHRRPSFTYIAMALADYVKMSFSPASVGAQTLQIANDMLATVEGNSNINVDFTTPVADPFNDSAIGLEI